MTGIKRRQKRQRKFPNGGVINLEFGLQSSMGKAEYWMDHPAIWKLIDEIRAVKKGRDL